MYWYSLVPRADGTLDYGMYYPWSAGLNLSKYGIGFYYATGDFGWQHSLIGYHVGNETWGDLGTLVSVDENIVLPIQSTLSAFPNPFNSSISIEWRVADQGKHLLEIHDLRGQVVFSETISQNAPFHALRWNAGDQISSGLYIVSLKGEWGVINKKILLLR